jgi:hypothetical protein
MKQREQAHDSFFQSLIKSDGLAKPSYDFTAIPDVSGRFSVSTQLSRSVFDEGIEFAIVSICIPNKIGKYWFIDRLFWLLATVGNAIGIGLCQKVK